MQTSPVRLIEYFEGRKQNLIPLFQRPYRWNRENWEQLWRDLEESDTERPHFTGAIVSLPVKTMPIGVNKFLIIDGQQRLTTIALLLAALRGFLEGNVRERVQEYLINRYDDGADRYKLYPTHVDIKAFRAIVEGEQEPSDPSLILTGYRYFLEQIQKTVEQEESTSASDLLTKLEHALKVVMINLDDTTEDPYEIFESLNATGTPLTAADLIRNYILMQFKHSIGDHSEQERIHKNLWLPIEANCGESLQLFFMHYCRTDGKEVQKKGVYRAFKERLEGKTAPDVEETLIGIKAYSAIYPKLLRPETEANLQVRGPLVALNTLGVSVYYPLLLRLFKSYEDAKLSSTDLSAALRLVESFAIRRAVCNIKNNALDGFLAKVVATLPSTEILMYLESKLSSGTGNLRWPLNAEFLAHFVSDDQYKRSATEYVLWSLEREFAHKEAIEHDGLSIEHVLPQTLNESWRTALGDDASQTDAWKNRFGNLTLTGYNPELSNKPYQEKRAIYAQSHLELNKVFSGYPYWTFAEIEDRGKLMAEKAAAIWRGPSSGTENT